jgi:hypothetical protein
MKTRILIVLGIWILVSLTGMMAFSAQQGPTPQIGGVVGPITDQNSLDALKPIVAKRNALIEQISAVQAQFRVAQQQALAAAKPPYDPLYYGVDMTGTKYIVTRPLPRGQ